MTSDSGWLTILFLWVVILADKIQLHDTALVVVAGVGIALVVVRFLAKWFLLPKKDDCGCHED